MLRRICLYTPHPQRRHLDGPCHLSHYYRHAICQSGDKNETLGIDPDAGKVVRTLSIDDSADNTAVGSKYFFIQRIKNTIEDRTSQSRVCQLIASTITSSVTELNKAGKTCVPSLSAKKA